MKAGLRKQLTHIHGIVESKSRELDTIYDFGNLMIKDRVVPAVITEARDLYNQDGAYVLRLSGAYYKIEQQPRFASVPPNWRESICTSVQHRRVMSHFSVICARKMMRSAKFGGNTLPKAGSRA